MQRSDVKPASAQVGIHPRIVSILALTALVTALAFVARGVYFAASDSWIVPINLSPDSDAVLQVNIRLNEQLMERARLRADVERIGVDVVGVDSAIARLQAVKANGHEALVWTANATQGEAGSLRSKLRSLEGQRTLLHDMLGRESQLATKTQKNVALGLLSQQDDEREAQTLAQLRLTVAETERELDETRHQSAALRRASEALKIGMSQGRAVGGVLPEIVEREERDARIELEVIKLEAERRGLDSQKKIAIDSLVKMDEILKQISSRPVYRAVQASTDVAFVPYTQLKGVESGVELVSCAWGIFKCHTVGHVSEVLPGEVVAQDPWSEIARGQYAILELSDREASREKVLRVRHPR